MQGCMCTGCLTLSAIPDVPTCKKCGEVAEEVNAEGLCPVCVKPKRVRKPRAKTHGKNGVAPLAAMPPDEAIPEAIREEGALPVGELGHADTEPHHATTKCEGCGGTRKIFNELNLSVDACPECTVLVGGGEAIPEEEEQPNDKAPPAPPFSAGTVCKVCGDFEPCEKSHFTPMPCARVGCNDDAVPGSCWCRGHGTAAAAVDDGLPRRTVGKGVPADVLREALEAAWVALAEDSTLDPVTVAVCKRLRDLERGL